MSVLQLRLMLMFYSFHKFTTGICEPQYKFTRIFGAEIAFSSLVFAPQCKSRHERGAGKGASDDERQRRSNFIMTDFYNLIPSAPEGRFEGIERPYTAADVERLRGSVQIKYTLAEQGANRLWKLIHEEDFVNALGALSGNQAMQMVRAGLKAIYLSLIHI